MTKRIYVGNLPFSATEAEVRDLFEEHGSVHSVDLVSDRDTGRLVSRASADTDSIMDLPGHLL